MVSEERGSRISFLNVGSILLRFKNVGSIIPRFNHPGFNNVGSIIPRFNHPGFNHPRFNEPGFSDPGTLTYVLPKEKYESGRFYAALGLGVTWTNEGPNGHATSHFLL